jgi:hypothetical protein
VQFLNKQKKNTFEDLISKKQKSLGAISKKTKETSFKI